MKGHNNPVRPFRSDLCRRYSTTAQLFAQARASLGFMVQQRYSTWISKRRMRSRVLDLIRFLTMHLFDLPLTLPISGRVLLFDFVVSWMYHNTSSRRHQRYLEHDVGIILPDAISGPVFKRSECPFHNTSAPEPPFWVKHVRIRIYSWVTVYSMML